LRPFSWLLLAWSLGGLAQAAEPSPAWKSLEDFWGAPGWRENGLEVLGFPRSDLNVMVEGVPLQAELGLTSRLKFRALSKGLAVKGQLVLLDQESRRVEAKLILDGFKLEGLQCLLVGETPAVKLLEFSGKGGESILNAQLKEILGLTGTPPTPLSFPTPAPGEAQAWAPLQEALGQKGFVQGKTLWVLAPGFSPASDPGIGFYSLRFQKEGGNLLVMGEAVLEAAPLAAVLKILAHEKMTVTALAPLASQAGATRLRWWGAEDAAALTRAVQKVTALAAPSDASAAEPTPGPTPEASSEGL